jgi:hypothetical protein
LSGYGGERGDARRKPVVYVPGSLPGFASSYPTRRTSTTPVVCSGPRSTSD